MYYMYNVCPHLYSLIFVFVYIYGTYIYGNILERIRDVAMFGKV